MRGGFVKERIRVPVGMFAMTIDLEFLLKLLSLRPLRLCVRKTIVTQSRKGRKVRISKKKLRMLHYHYRSRAAANVCIRSTKKVTIGGYKMNSGLRLVENIDGNASAKKFICVPINRPTPRQSRSATVRTVPAARLE